MNRRPVGAKRERVEKLAATTHGSLLLGHALGLGYQLMDPDRDLGNWFCAGLHFGGFVFSAVATWEHSRGETP